MSKQQKRTWDVILVVVMVLLCLLWIYPIVLILLNSLKTEGSFTTSTVFRLPTAETFAGLRNYVYGVTKMDFLSSMGYSLLITITSVVLILLCCSMTGWYLTRVNNKLSKFMNLLIVFSMVVPFQMVMFTLSKTADRLNLNNPWNICIIYLGFGAGLAVFMFTGFMKSVPMEIEEAAMIDGCNPIQIFFKVVFPILKPTMISTAILETMWVWNDYLLPTLVLDIAIRSTAPSPWRSSIASGGGYGRQGQAGLADWPDALRCREPEVIAAAKVRLADQISYHKAVQFFFYTQWNALKAYANRKGVLLVGDIPIYVSPDSSDLWTQPELFQTDGQMHLTHVAGCPPDSFAADGQLWGNPLYDWPTHKATGFGWWKRRMKHATSIYDVVRIDHFRGFESYYSIPAENTTAAGGHWEKGPDRDFIHAMQQALGGGNIIAEDLGYLTPEVKAMLAESGYPGMKIMQFAFDSRESGNYLPHTYPRNSVVYTGTHDNVTTEGWRSNASAEDVSLRLPVSALHTGDPD